ncbi:hypothetical protein [Methylomagnum ishizawai]|uniref:hypothetical protein n=1 Tax=Methylomagnum ishizawai TaxID=1760988 RepID=UPI001C81458F|nr:hypothetical protein [Methylomagnum ishizawai]
MLRDTYNADGTMALVANTIYCGMNWPMSTVYPGFGEYAYTLAGRDRAKGYYSFGHGPGPPTTGSWIPPAILPISSGTTPAWAGL